MRRGNTPMLKMMKAVSGMNRLRRGGCAMVDGGSGLVFIKARLRG